MKRFNKNNIPQERDVRDRQTVLKSVTEGIMLPGNTTPRTLPKLFTQEVRISATNSANCDDLLLHC